MILEIWAAVIWWVGHLLSLANWILSNFYVDCTRAATFLRETAAPVFLCFDAAAWNPDPEYGTVNSQEERGAVQATQGPLCPVTDEVPSFVLVEVFSRWGRPKKSNFQIKPCISKQTWDTPCLVTMYPNGRNILHNAIISSWDNAKLKEKTTIQNKCLSLMSSAPCSLLKFPFSYAALKCNFCFFPLSLLDLMWIQPPSGLGNIPFSTAVNSVALMWRLESWTVVAPKCLSLARACNSIWLPGKFSPSRWAVIYSPG